MQHDSTVEVVATAINGLLKSHRIELLKNAAGQILYKEIQPDEQAKFKGLISEDMLVYQIIKAAGSQGIWTKDIKTR